MRLVDLFAGIGGFSYAAHQFGITTDVFVEKEPYPQKVLAKNFPGVPIVDDIFKLNAKVYEEITGQTRADIISGGFPCQPFSLAGQRKGTEDNRYLWGEMCRVIQELRPRWVIAENVYGIVNIQDGLVFETVHTDLEAQGYEVQTFIIPAAAKNAPHRRDRVWFVAHSPTIGCNNGSNNRQERPICKDSQRNDEKNKPERRKRELRTCKNSNSNVADTNEIRRGGCTQEKCRVQKRVIHSDKPKRCEMGSETNGCSNNPTDSEQKGLQRRTNKRSIRTIWQESEKQSTRLLCGEWQDFPTQPPVCGRNDGIPNRVDRIKALGNAIVPQVAMELFRNIIESEKRYKL